MDGWRNRDVEEVAEVSLPGGNMSGVVRVGATVRRNSGPWTPAVDAPLRYLEAAGFSGAPRALGMDAKGREVLAYLDGDVFQYPMPDFVWSDETVTATARLLRTYHDVVRDFVSPTDAAWQVHVGAPASGPVICHNDMAPYNTVFRDKVPVGFIDWSEAAPGPALYDIAHALWRWVPLQEASWAPVENQPRRLRLFCDAYGLEPIDRAQIFRIALAYRARPDHTRLARVACGEQGQPSVVAW